MLNFFKKKPAPASTSLELQDMQRGYLFDYDMRTWQVLAVHDYVYGKHHKAREWEVEHSNERCFLQRSSDDEVSWCWGAKINLHEITPDVRKSIIDSDDPPNTITVRGQQYHLEESGTGLFYREQDKEAAEFIYWELIDAQDKHFITIEQWDETDFTASLATQVERWQFSNVLPPAENS